MVPAISSTHGASAAYQANLANMQQQLAQQLFQVAGGSPGGTISQAQFDSFYNQFMGTTSQTTGPGQTSAADRLFQQVNSTGNGQLTLSQFAAALKLMMAQNGQGLHHPHHAGSATGAAANGASQNASQSSGSSASNSTTAMLGQLLAAANQNGAAQSAQPQHGKGIEFVA